MNCFYHTDTSRIKIKTDSSIVIDSDSDFEIYSSGGNGTNANPFIIENFTIFTDFDIGILIVNTTKCFKLRNCNVSAISIGILLHNITSSLSTIEENIVKNNDLYGIYSQFSYNITIKNNTISETTISISSFKSDNIITENNTCFDSEGGISYYYSVNGSIKKNNCFSNRIGINVRFSSYITTCENMGNNSEEGISYYNVTYSNIISNKMYGSYTGLTLWFSQNCLVEENSLYRNQLAIDLDHTNNIEIIGNNCSKNTNSIFISDTQNSIILNNLCNDNEQIGLHVRLSSQCEIRDNFCLNNGKSGIRIFQGNLAHLYQLQIINNTCILNQYGIYSKSADSLNISSNTISENVIGTYFEETSFSIISDNFFHQNDEYGVFLDIDSTWNKIYYNDFIDNNKKGTETGKSQGYDSGSNNRWYNPNTNIGNYWSDHKKNTPYKLDGDADNEDPFPVNNPFNYVEPNKTDFNICFIIVLPAIIITINTLRKIKRTKL